MIITPLYSLLLRVNVGDMRRRLYWSKVHWDTDGILRRPLFTSVVSGFDPERINDVGSCRRQRKALLSILGDFAPSELFFFAWRN